ncbi:RNA polymerase factor sigma-54 [Fundicoccus culcitae]|uniref:RNA polymerase subunit sigma-54 n=1 Tax=Fundicoccus culcitae TaxID=2969821 RepID=A0ABY5P2U5_9LACT|nr:RNA polymerase subunit sigma-54 [Fundicoccus culcitae]UUX32974.1 RNA polymerase subunit sigma-54 [Fundicoccus culcitae]
MTNSDQEHNIVLEDKDVKIFEGLSQLDIAVNEQLLDILDLNAEQLTYYLEDAILDNPFIDLDYALESFLGKNAQSIPEPNIRGVESQLPTSPQSLSVFLFEQIMMFRQTEIRDVMVRLVDYLDDNGYLPYTYQELAKEIEASSEMVVLDAMTLIKSLEPAGVGAYDLQESLMLQTERDLHAPDVAYYLLEEFYNEITEKDYVEIQQKSDITLDEIKQSVNYYHTLRPAPATLFDRQAKINLIPDVTLQVKNDQLALRYNRQYYPKITFNQTYYEEMQREPDVTLKAYIEPKKTAYLDLTNNLRKREHLILEVVKEIILHQSDFFFKGETEKKPLMIKDLATSTRLSEPIIKLIVTNKNIQFNQTVMPLTDFINVATHEGRGGLTAKKIKEIILDFLKDAPATMTDHEVVDELAKQKVIISERLINNYRKQL